MGKDLCDLKYIGGCIKLWSNVRKRSVLLQDERELTCYSFEAGSSGHYHSRPICRKKSGDPEDRR